MLQRTWQLPPSSEATLASRLRGLGFRSLGPRSWSRGTIWSSWFGMDPRTWRVRIHAETTGDALVVSMTVDAYGQIITGSERVFWQQEARRIEAAIHGESQLPVPYVQQGAIARVENWMLTALPIALSLAVGGVFTLVGFPLLAVLLSVASLIAGQLVLFGWARWRPLTAEEQVE